MLRCLLKKAILGESFSCAINAGVQMTREELDETRSI